MAIERATLANVTAGEDASPGMIKASGAPERLRAVSGEYDLNAEQIAWWRAGSALNSLRQEA